MNGQQTWRQRMTHEPVNYLWTRKQIKETTMEQFKPIEVPESHIAFAKAVAALAEENHIASFSMDYKPEGEFCGGQEWDHRTTGSASIHFAAKDGRGRPCRNLSINISATMQHAVESNQESCN